MKRLLLTLDLYGRPFHFRMLNGYTTHRSILGTIFSLLLLSITAVYSVNKFDILINHKESKLEMWQYDDYFDYNFEFDIRKYGYNFAFGIM